MKGGAVRDERSPEKDAMLRRAHETWAGDERQSAAI